MAMLKLRSRPLRAGSAHDVLGGATKSSHVMLSGLTQFCGSIGANGVDAALGFKRWAGKADAVSSIAAASTSMVAERPLAAIVAIVQGTETLNNDLFSDQLEE